MTFLCKFPHECTLPCLYYFAQIPRKTRQGSGQTMGLTLIKILIMPFNFISMSHLASPGLAELCKASLQWFLLKVHRQSGSASCMAQQLGTCTNQHSPVYSLSPHLLLTVGVGLKDQKERNQEMKESKQTAWLKNNKLHNCHSNPARASMQEARCPTPGERALKWTWQRKKYLMQLNIPQETHYFNSQVSLKRFWTKKRCHKVPLYPVGKGFG